MLFIKISAVLTLSNLIGLFLFSTTALANASVENPIGYYPGNTAALSAFEIYTPSLQKVLPLIPLPLRTQLQTELDSFVSGLKEKGFRNLLQGLSQVSGHISVAYRPRAGHWGDFLLQIETQNENTLELAMTDIAKMKSVPFRTLQFANRTLYQISLDDKRIPELSDLKLTLSQQGKFIQGSLGLDHKSLTEMIYLSQVHPPESPWRLSGQKDVMNAQQILSPRREQWAYLRTQNLKAIMATLSPWFPNIQNLETEDPWVQDVLHYIKSAGVSIHVDTREKPSVTLKLLTQHDTHQLSAYQQQFIRRRQQQNYNFSTLLSHFPAPLTAFFTGDIQDVFRSQDIPSDHKVPAQWNTFMEKNTLTTWSQALAQYTQIDYTKDLEPYLAGPFAAALLPSSTQTQELNNHVGVIFDLKSDTNITKILSQRLGTAAPTAVKNLTNNITAYKINLSNIPVLKINALLPDIASSEDGVNKSMLYFAQIPATQEQPARLCLSNHLTALESMVQEPKKPQVSYQQVDSPYHFYVDISLLTKHFNHDLIYRNHDLRRLIDELKFVYNSEKQQEQDTETHWTFYTANQTSSKLELINTTPILMSLTAVMLISEFESTASRPSESHVKANMHTLQTVVETYGVDAYRIYPATLAELSKEAKAGHYDKKMINVYNPSGPTVITLEEYLQQSGFPAGVVIYEPIRQSNKKTITGYRIYGTNGKGLLIRNPDHPNKPLILSNSSEISHNPALSRYLDH